MTTLINYYSGNRKYYSPTSKGYITALDILRHAQRGDVLNIVDTSTQRDITAETVLRLTLEVAAREAGTNSAVQLLGQSLLMSLRLSVKAPCNNANAGKATRRANYLASLRF